MAYIQKPQHELLQFFLGSSKPEGSDFLACLFMQYVMHTRQSKSTKVKDPLGKLIHTVAWVSLLQALPNPFLPVLKS